MGCDVAVFVVCDDERVVVAILVGVVAREHGELLAHVPHCGVLFDVPVVVVRRRRVPDFPGLVPKQNQIL